MIKKKSLLQLLVIYIAVITVATLIPNTSKATISSIGYDFEEVEIGSSEKTMVTITNLEDTDTVISGLVFVNTTCSDFSILHTPDNLTIPAKGIIEVEIGYTPSSIGTCSDTLRIYNGTPFPSMVTLVGTGIEPVVTKLDPFYARAHEKLQLGPYNYDFHYWKKELPNLNPFPLDGKVIWNKMWQYSLAQFGSLYTNTITNAKKIHLYTYANVVDIISNDTSTEIKEVIVKNHGGKTHKVKAKHFILACGAIQNARLLLASNSQAPRGLGNDNDIVGRYFMEHIEHKSAELWLAKPFSTNLYSWEYGVTKASAELAITEKAQTENRILNGTVSLFPLTFGRSIKSEMDIWNDKDPRKSLERFINSMTEAFDAAEKVNEGSISRAFQLNTRIEQAPNPNSRITIGPEKDELGVPKAKLNWELTELDKRSIRRIYQLLSQQMGISELGRVRLMEFLRDENDNSWPADLNAGWHHMGTTRMSDDPKRGVVTSNCQVHGISNLYVAGSGCYVTSGAPNPTLTLVALSLRLSDYVKGKM